MWYVILTPYTILLLVEFSVDKSKLRDTKVCIQVYDDMEFNPLNFALEGEVYRGLRDERS